MSYFDNIKIKILNVHGEDMPDDKYFGLKGFTSISKLKLLDPEHAGSPAKYKAGFNYDYNESLLLGTAIHQQILEPDDFILSDYENKPSGKLGNFIENICINRKSGMNIVESIKSASTTANYYNGKLTDKIIKKAIKQGLDYYLHLTRGDFTKEGKQVVVLSKKLLDTAKASINSVNNCFGIQQILKNNIIEPKQYFNEIALFADIEVTLPDNRTHIIKFKGKLDSVVWDSENQILYLNDVKTTSKPLKFFMGSVHNGVIYPGVFYHHIYYAQLAIYSILLQKYFQEVLKITDYTLYANIFAVETTGNYSSECFRINNEYIKLGIKKIKELLGRLSYCELYGYDNELPI